MSIEEEAVLSRTGDDQGRRRACANPSLWGEACSLLNPLNAHISRLPMPAGAPGRPQFRLHKSFHLNTIPYFEIINYRDRMKHSSSFQNNRVSASFKGPSWWGKLFFTLLRQLINVGRMMERSKQQNKVKHHSATLNFIIDSGKDHRWRLNH